MKVTSDEIVAEMNRISTALEKLDALTTISDPKRHDLVEWLAIGVIFTKGMETVASEDDRVRYRNIIEDVAKKIHFAPDVQA